MKRFSFSAICVLALVALCGCSKNESTTGSRTTSSQSSVESVLQQRMAEVDAENAFGEPISAQIPPSNIASAETAALAPAHKAPEPIKSESVSVDVDLTALSSTMVYSEVLNIMTAPETYIGKTLKMKGYYGYYHDEKTDKYYFACMIPDATACCAQGIEFILTDDYLFPDDYPQEGEIVTVAGEFMTYEEDGSTYFTLKDSKLLS
ncbi:MAG: hypothetical protein J5647_12725 [Spirochaetaceae bacterium]|nr:hypothetical protein [Spirochaetaceae bacterium]